MFKLKNFLSVLLVVGLATLFLPSCSESDDDSIAEFPETVQESAIATIFNATNRTSDPDSAESDSLGTEGDFELEDDCFDFVYPITISFPDGTTSGVASNEDLETVIDDWFSQNPESESFPEFVYPLEITTADVAQTVNSEEELCEIIASCFDEDDDDEDHDDEEEDDDNDNDDDDDDDEILDYLCFEFIFPLIVTLPDSTEVSVGTNEELFTALENCVENSSSDDYECAELSFPFTVIDTAGIETEIVNEEAFELAFDSCEVD